MARVRQSRLGGSGPSDHFSDRDFRGLNSFPNENTLTVNVTHKQLRRLNPPFKKLVAIAPTRYEEGASNATNTPLGKGYDIKLETAKEVVFQHKAPDNAVVRDGKQWLNYTIDMDQLLLLAFRYKPKEAFYALPATPEHQQIRDGLQRTIFVDVWSVFLNSLNQLKNTSRIYVQYQHDKSTVPDVWGKYSTLKREMGGYPYYRLIAKKHFHGDAITWDPIENKLKGCEMGLPIRGINPERYPFHFEINDPPGFSNNYLDQVSPAYRNHLRNRYAIHSYTSSEEHREEILDWLTDSLQRTLDASIQHELVSVPSEMDLTSEEYQNELRTRLNRLSEHRNPMTYRLNRTQRCILEKGDEESTLTV